MVLPSLAETGWAPQHNACTLDAWLTDYCISQQLVLKQSATCLTKQEQFKKFI
jgi:hypothetical protein